MVQKLKKPKKPGWVGLKKKKPRFFSSPGVAAPSLLTFSALCIV